MRNRRVVALAVFSLAIVVAGCLPAAPPEHWLDVVNEYRTAAHLPLLTEDAALSAGAQRHAEYTARTGVVEHRQDPYSPHFSAEGGVAATQSNVAKEDDVNTSDRAFVEKWIAAPFHAVGVLDPRLQRAGYGSFRDGGTPIRAAAAMNVIAGMTGAPWNDVVTFPADGSSVGLRESSREYPNPLKGCGYGFPAGLPVLVMLPTASEVVVASSLHRDWQSIELCRFDGYTFTNPDPVAQQVGREALLTRNAAVLVPRNPLEPGTYVAAVATNQRNVSWTFTIR